MNDRIMAWVMVGIFAANVAVLVVPLLVLRDHGMENGPFRPRRCDRLFGLTSTLGVIMSALDDALARFSAFVRDVADKLTGAKADNDAQTAKLAELQARLDGALADDAADKASIAALQDEVNTLQDRVAAQINAAVDAVSKAAAEQPVAVEPVAGDDLVVVEDPEAPVEG